MKKVSAPPRKVHRIDAHGMTYTIDPGQRRPQRRAIVDHGEPYELPLLEHIYEQNFEGFVVDVGAAEGNHTLWFTVVCRLRVAAYEPIHYKELIKNVKRNAVSSMVNVYPFALGAKNGYARKTGPINLEPARRGEIEVSRLDDQHLPRTSMIKIDVEGMERAVLRGAVHTIKRDHPVIFAEEWKDPKWHRGIAEILEPLGYEMTHRFEPPALNTPMGRWDYVH